MDIYVCGSTVFSFLGKNSPVHYETHGVRTRHEPAKLHEAPRADGRQPLPHLSPAFLGDMDCGGQGEAFCNISNSSFHGILTHNNQKN